MSQLGPLVPFVLVLAVFWLLILRPQQRRQRELRHLQSSLSAGNEVMLTSGIYGTVSTTADDHVLVEVAPGVTLKVARGAIAQLTKPTESADAQPVDGEPTGDVATGSEEN